VKFDQEPLRAPWVREALDWLGHDSMWEHMIRQRLAHRCSQLHIEFTYRDEYGIDASFAAECQHVLKLGIGGRFKEARDTRHEVEVAFWPFPEA
tara:strand:+ start:385 stop:666 length:282 start_codon:yes stop_codon:yes gene_type:complete